MINYLKNLLYSWYHSNFELVMRVKYQRVMPRRSKKKKKKRFVFLKVKRLSYSVLLQMNRLIYLTI